MADLEIAEADGWAELDDFQEHADARRIDPRALWELVAVDDHERAVAMLVAAGWEIDAGAEVRMLAEPDAEREERFRVWTT
jgi:hypothetical protein